MRTCRFECPIERPPLRIFNVLAARRRYSEGTCKAFDWRVTRSIPGFTGERRLPGTDNVRSCSLELYCARNVIVRGSDSCPPVVFLDARVYRRLKPLSGHGPRYPPFKFPRRGVISQGCSGPSAPRSSLSPGVYAKVVYRNNRQPRDTDIDCVASALSRRERSRDKSRRRIAG